MRRLTIRTSGYALFLFLFIDLALIFLNFHSPTQTLNIFLHGDLFAIISTLVCFAIIIYIIAYILINRIVLTDDYITFRTLTFFPGKIVMNKASLTEIDNIFFGQEKFIRNHLNPNDVKELDDFYKRFRSGYTKAVRFGVSYADILVVTTKDRRILIVSTKPFSKNSFRRLFSQLSELHIVIQTQYKKF
jgi:hypothetical protein